MVLALQFGVILIDCRDRRPRLSKDGLPRGRHGRSKNAPTGLIVVLNLSSVGERSFSSRLA